MQLTNYDAKIIRKTNLLLPKF